MYVMLASCIAETSQTVLEHGTSPDGWQISRWLCKEILDDPVYISSALPVLWRVLGGLWTDHGIDLNTATSIEQISKPKSGLVTIAFEQKPLCPTNQHHPPPIGPDLHES